jgi:hypothetical protein
MQEHRNDTDWHAEEAEPRPRWLLAIGVVLLVAMMLAAAFAIGVYVAERNLLH